MNPHKQTNAGLGLCLLAGVTGLFVCALPAAAADAPKPDPKALAAALALTNRVESTFVWDYKTKGFGRDPFYPEKVWAPPTVATNTATNTPTDTGRPTPPPPPPKVELTLQGINFGRIAIINGKQFEKGEEGMVNIPAGGKARIRLDDIKPGAVEVTVYSSDKPEKTEKRELNLKGR